MYWEYSNIISREKWLAGAGTVQQDFRDATYQEWVATAQDAGYVEVSHNDGTMSPQWRDATGNWTSSPTGGQPDAYRMTITGEVS